MAYKTIHTTYGLQRMQQAETTGTPINLVAMAVGDGNGNTTKPDPGQTHLVRERYRAAPNRVYQDPDTGLHVMELIVPRTAGGFTLRELAAIDDRGSLYLVGNLPDTYIPAEGEGAFSDAVVRVPFAVTNAGVVTLKVDPNVAVATQTWIINNVTPAMLLPGGLTGQVLKKRSNANGDVAWGDPAEVHVVVGTIEEEQTLAAGQTQVDLEVTNTTGLAVYIAGDRLPKDASADGWQPDPAIATRLVLGKAYPAGARLIAVQNEPASHMEAALVRDQNLADLPDAAAARNNLGVYGKSDVDAKGKAPGEVFYTTRGTAPAGSLKANGATVSRTAYAALFAVIGTTYGKGDGFNTFNLPDLRGEFIRSFDDGRGVDSGRALGTWQAGENAAHSHGVNDPGHTHDGGNLVGSLNYNSNGGNFLEEGQGAPNYLREAMERATTGITIQSSGGDEARPRNVALLACIQF
jgi:phage-related tail fiber protein